LLEMTDTPPRLLPLYMLSRIYTTLPMQALRNPIPDDTNVSPSNAETPPSHTRPL